jgi:hypothetical protein
MDSNNSRYIVAVCDMGIGSSYAFCTCGWLSSRRLLKAAACQDAWAHAGQNGCELRNPLVTACPDYISMTVGTIIGWRR